VDNFSPCYVGVTGDALAGIEIRRQRYRVFAAALGHGKGSALQRENLMQLGLEKECGALSH
jgi:hypothetical protein